LIEIKPILGMDWESVERQVSDLEQFVMTAQRAITKTEQNRALGLSTLAFTACFAVWTIFAIIGIRIKAELGLNEAQFGLLIGTPI
jgi:hypothetical protein